MKFSTGYIEQTVTEVSDFHHLTFVFHYVLIFLVKTHTTCLIELQSRKAVVIGDKKLCMTVPLSINGTVILIKEEARRHLSNVAGRRDEAVNVIADIVAKVA